MLLRAAPNNLRIVTSCYIGLTNWSAAYATGLLLARRVNAKFNLSYEGNTEVNGEDYNVEAEEEGPRPFKALLDVGLRRTTTGARLFGALKGATDGGLNIPHSDRRYPGSTRTGADVTSDPEVVRKYIFGLHIADYMKQLQEDDEEVYQRQFAQYIKVRNCTHQTRSCDSHACPDS